MVQTLVLLRSSNQLVYLLLELAECRTVVKKDDPSRQRNVHHPRQEGHSRRQRADENEHLQELGANPTRGDDEETPELVVVAFDLDALCGFHDEHQEECHLVDEEPGEEASKDQVEEEDRHQHLVLVSELQGRCNLLEVRRWYEQDLVAKLGSVHAEDPR